MTTRQGCAIAVGLFALALLVVASFAALAVLGANVKPTTSTRRTPDPPRADLQALVQFNDGRFSVTNLDAYGWSGCELEVNGAFELEVGSLAPGEQVTAGALQFTKRNGERFNPFTHAPKRMTVRCETPHGRRYYFAGW